MVRKIPRVSTKNPAYALELVLKLAKERAGQKCFELTQEECEALELVSRYQHYLERKQK